MPLQYIRHWVLKNMQGLHSLYDSFVVQFCLPPDDVGMFVLCTAFCFCSFARWIRSVIITAVDRCRHCKSCLRNQSHRIDDVAVTQVSGMAAVGQHSSHSHSCTDSLAICSPCYIMSSPAINALMGTGNYSATLNNVKMVHWPLMSGLLDVVFDKENQSALVNWHCWLAIGRASGL